MYRPRESLSSDDYNALSEALQKLPHQDQVTQGQEITIINDILSKTPRINQSELNFLLKIVIINYNLVMIVCITTLTQYSAHTALISFCQTSL